MATARIQINHLRSHLLSSFNIDHLQNLELTTEKLKTEKRKKEKFA